MKLLLNDELPTSTTTAAASTMGVTIDDKDVGIKLVKKLKSVQQRDNDPIGYRGILKTSGKSDEKNSTSKGTKLDEGNSSGVRTADSSSQREGFIHSASVIGHDVGLSASNKSGKMMLTFYVEDNGIGISEEKQQVLFQPFKQAQRLAGGTGLGLFSLARRLEALGGRYGVCGRSDGASGSVFWFSFPYRPGILPPPPPLPPAPSPSLASSVISPTNTLSIHCQTHINIINPTNVLSIPC